MTSTNLGSSSIPILTQSVSMQVKDGASSQEGIQHNAVGHGTVLDGIAHERDRLHCEMIGAALGLVIPPDGRLLPFLSEYHWFLPSAFNQKKQSA